MNLDLVVRSVGGSDERIVEAGSIQIPDLWHLAHRQRNEVDTDAILEVWHLAHDLLDHVVLLAAEAEDIKAGKALCEALPNRLAKLAD